MPQRSTSVRLSESTQRRLSKLNRLSRERAQRAVPTRLAHVHGNRLRYMSREGAQIVGISDVLLTPEGDVSEVRCSICIRESAVEWPLGCIHSTGLVLHAMDGALRPGDAPTLHALLTRSPGVIRARLRRNKALDIWSMPAGRRSSTGAVLTAGSCSMGTVSVLSVVQPKTKNAIESMGLSLGMFWFPY